MISQLLISGALVPLRWRIFDRMHTPATSDAYGSLVNRIPAYALFFMFFTMAKRRPAAGAHLAAW